MNFIFAVPGGVLLVISFVLRKLAKREELLLKQMTGGTVGNVKMVETRRARRARINRLYEASALCALVGVLGVALGPYFFGSP